MRNVYRRLYGPSCTQWYKICCCRCRCCCCCCCCWQWWLVVTFPLLCDQSGLNEVFSRFIPFCFGLFCRFFFIYIFLCFVFLYLKRFDFMRQGSEGGMKRMKKKLGKFSEMSPFSRHQLKHLRACICCVNLSPLLNIIINQRNHDDVKFVVCIFKRHGHRPLAPILCAIVWECVSAYIHPSIRSSTHPCGCWCIFTIISLCYAQK